MTPLGHVMILASAGSGKTYALTNRFVRLLALGAKPERIVALTFTRKAAGEFFDEILNKLARAAREPDDAARLAREIGAPALGAPDFLRMLRAVTDAMHRLRLGTFDGFFARVVRNFPLELGLTGEFELLQDHAARRERARVLRRMFERTGELATAQREFIEAFKRATFGVDEKRLGAQLDAFLDDHQEVFLAAPERARWGDPARIWPGGCAWLEAAARRGATAQALRAGLATVEMNEKQRARWDLFFADLEAWSPGATMGGGLVYLLKNALAVWPELAEIVIERKKMALPPPVRDALRHLLQGIVGAELGRRLEMTRGIYAVLAGYDATYHDTVRRAGKLTFADVQRLLAPDASAPVLSRSGFQPAGENDERLFIDFRLDAEIDHWLLDEFQDTSFGQWSVLKNLIDEVVQDPTQARTFFYVGDVKQAIFAWREGDPRLFREIFDHYNAVQPGTIAEEHLVKSWRSGPPVIGMVNAVFGDQAALAELFPGEASATWNREWRTHASARPELGGHVAWWHAVAAEGGGSGADEAARFARTLAILHEIEPLERGLSCAVLVQKNETATRLADYLRHEGGLAAVAESDLRVCTDNPLGAALLALVKAAAHPGDTVAREHLQMTPLGDVLAAEDGATPEAWTRRVLGQIHADGFERTMEAWWAKLEPRLASDDVFSRERARQFIAAAGLFDATGSREVAEFVSFMERHTVRDADTTAVVRVMTIHKAKGLGFDLVLLPDLEGTKLDGRREGLAVKKTADRSVDWVLDLPPKLLAETDAVLAAYIREAEASACYENLSLLYVAMTRAKRAMYIITKPPGKSTSRNFPRLLAATLGEESAPVRVGRLEGEGPFSAGDADWHTRVQLSAAAPAPVAMSRLDPEAVAMSPRLPARRASAGTDAVLAGKTLFSLAEGGGADFGTAMHALLAEVDGWRAEEADARARAWRARGVDAAVAGEALACLGAPELAEVFAPRSASEAEVWRERAFEGVIDGTWVTGVFDRVVIERDAGRSGRPVRATVFDFKTDRLAGEAELAEATRRHAAQLRLYRRAVALLTGLPLARVGAELVFTGSARRVAVPV